MTQRKCVLSIMSQLSENIKSMIVSSEIALFVSSVIMRRCMRFAAFSLRNLTFQTKSHKHYIARHSSKERIIVLLVTSRIYE